MRLPMILVYFATLLQASFFTPTLAAKPKPVDLEFMCTQNFDVTRKDFKQDNVPVILIHGLSLGKESWHGIYESIALATKKKVCAVDLRNHGESPWNNEDYDVAAMTEDVRHLIDHIDVPRAIVLGHSLGGSVAVHLALNYPEKVEKIIVEDMRPNGMTTEAITEVESYSLVLKELEEFIPQGLTEKEAKETIIPLLKENLKKVNLSFDGDDLTVVPVKCLNGKCSLSVNPVFLDAVMSDITVLLNDSPGPFDEEALFIYGTDSNFRVGEDERNIKKLFPNAKLVAVEGAGHTVHTSKEFTEKVIEFINNK